MDSVAEIKSRLPIEELVRQYTQLTKKGRNFVGLCPFHKDTRPSMLVSPDKGIAYCFPCQKGGDIFSFYQAVENVDFSQALRELAEKTGVTLETKALRPEAKDEKDRLRACLEAASLFFRSQLSASGTAKEYLQKRGVTVEECERFELGFAPDLQAGLYDHLLKHGFSRKEIVTAGMAMQRELGSDRVFDRFRGRIMFPIRDVQERLIGFGGRTIIGDDAKYMNTSDGPLYHKSGVLYGLPLAREAMRHENAVIVVEGYFDVLACHRAGVHHVVATCGTALTEEHARLLKRSVSTVILCLDSDRAGQAAAERAFTLLRRSELAVNIVRLPEKDPADLVLEQPDLLRQLLLDRGVTYIESVFEEIHSSEMASPAGRRGALDRLTIIFQALPTAAERMAFVAQAAPVLGVTESQLESDFMNLTPKAPSAVTPADPPPGSTFSSLEIALGLFLLYPQHRSLLQELIPPEEGIAVELFTALKDFSGDPEQMLPGLAVTDAVRERATILQLYCEEHGFSQWGESLAVREIRRNCQNANRDVLRRKQAEITSRLVAAQKEGKVVEEELLRTQYQQLLKLAKMAL